MALRASPTGFLTTSRDGDSTIKWGAREQIQRKTWGASIIKNDLIKGKPRGGIRICTKTSRGPALPLEALAKYFPSFHALGGRWWFFILMLSVSVSISDSQRVEMKHVPRSGLQGLSVSTVIHIIAHDSFLSFLSLFLFNNPIARR